MSQSTTSYAQALNDARQLIVQQQYRIKADADKIRSQQQTIVDQSNALMDHERKCKDSASEVTRLTEEVTSLTQKLQEAMLAKTQVESVLDQQGHRLASMQTASAEMERKISEQSARIGELEAERDGLSAQLPSKEDADALSQMLDLLSRRPESMKRTSTGPTMKLADVISTDDSNTPPMAQAA